jgi:hypothetical protein
MKVASFSDYIVEALRSRNYTDLGYNLVSLRTNYAETHVVGVLGDGMVFHPFPWCDVGALYHPLTFLILSPVLTLQFLVPRFLLHPRWLPSNRSMGL